jgi:hypothetical protein
MESLAQLLEALLMSLAVIATAALDMLLLVWIILCALVVALLLRLLVHAIWQGMKAGYAKAMRPRHKNEAVIRARMTEQGFCHFCGASVPHRESEGRCDRCMWVMK